MTKGKPRIGRVERTLHDSIRAASPLSFHILRQDGSLALDRNGSLVIVKAFTRKSALHLAKQRQGVAFARLVPLRQEPGGAS